MDCVKFSNGNRKMNKLAKHLGLPKSGVYSFDLPAGHTCPMADICKTMADRNTGKVTKGENNQVFCYAVKAESPYPSVRKLRWGNFDAIKALINDPESIAEKILESFPKNAKVVRVHSSGDFFHKNYFTAWQYVAMEKKDVEFFGYSKLLNFILHVGKSLDNFNFAYSVGGKADAKALPLIKNGSIFSNFIITKDWQVSGDLKTAYSPIYDITVPIMDAQLADDYHYIKGNTTFGILEHQKKAPSGAFLFNRARPPGRITYKPLSAAAAATNDN